MADAATARISGSQIRQGVHDDVTLDTDTVIPQAVERLVDEPVAEPAGAPRPQAVSPGAVTDFRTVPGCETMR